MASSKPTSITDGSADRGDTSSPNAEYGASESLRRTGIDIIGDVPWGTHFCQFYQTRQDLIDTLVPYFAAGLDSNEFCMWVTSEPLGVEEAREALRKAVPDLDQRLEAGRIEIIPHTDWYLLGGTFDQHRVLDGWVRKLNDALADGYEGLRLTGNTFWLEKGDWRDFTEYEEAVNSVIGNYRMLAVCTYSIDKCGAGEIADVIANHEFAIMKRDGNWTTIENSTAKQAKQTLQAALIELDSRTRKLEETNEELTASTEELLATNDELHATENELRREIDERKRTEQALYKLNRTLRARSESDQAMMRATDESLYLQEVCKIIVEDCGHAMVWIGYAENDEVRSVRPVAYSGFEEGYLETLNITWADTERGRGPTGTAIRTGKPSACRNMLTDPKFKPWREEAIKRGYASSIVLPLTSDGKVFGAVTIYSREPDTFSEDEVALLRGLADDLAYGITAIRLRTTHAQAERALHESEQRVRLKLDSILSPEGDIGDLELGGILDTEPVQSLMESFYRLARIPMAIIDLNGRVLVGVGWQDVCTRFHRVHPETSRHCIESDTQLTAGVPPGESRLYKCKNNMWDVSTPIVIGGKQVGNIFSGQFFFDDEPLDYDLFRSQARRYGFDEKEYIAALERVPRLSRGYLNQGMAFFAKLADILSKLSYSNIELARSLTERGRLMDALQEGEVQLRTIVENLTEGLVVCDLDGNLFQWNHAALRMHGFADEKEARRSLPEFAEIFELSGMDGSLWPPDEWPLARILRGEQLHNLEARIRRIGTDWERVFSYGGTLVRDPDDRPILAVVTLSDVTERFELYRQRENVYEREHHIAEVLQEAILPQDVPGEKLSYSIAVRYRPALKEAEIGGDFYDVFDLGDGRFGVVIGDVVGKGLPAAIRVASARHAIRSYAYLDPRPGRVLTLANESLCKDTSSESQMLTVFYAVIDPAIGGMMYASAGHEPPVITHPSGDHEELAVRGMPLGIFTGASFEQSSHELEMGDVVVMVTDGITEARNVDHELYGKERLVEFVNKHRSASPDEIATGLLEAATAHAGGQLQDDAALVVFSKQARKADK